MLLSSSYADALTYAAKAHDGQVRKGTAIPYIAHPIAVSGLVIEHGGSETQAIAGLLHDVLEDCGEEHAPAIARHFGDRVLQIVRGLTDGVPDEAGNKPEWRQRKEAYLDHLARTDADTVLVSACDKLHNARAIADDFGEVGEAVFERFSQPKASTIWNYRELIRVLGGRLRRDHQLVRKLEGAVNRWA